MTSPHPPHPSSSPEPSPPSYPHSPVFGSNLNFQLEQMLHSQHENPQEQAPYTEPQGQSQPHQSYPIPSQQKNKYHRRMEMY
jgi:hypothetical protein